MKKFLQNTFIFAFFAAIMVFCGIGIQKVYEFAAKLPTRITLTTEKELPRELPVELNAGWQLKVPSQSAEYIDGPLVADIGELCVFRLSNKDIKADWVIVPPAMCYIDSSGSSLAFASNSPAKYTIIAAVVEEGIPKILTHICEYGVQPQPEPEPQPKPDPKPQPDPQPNPNPALVLKDWVRRNVPESGQKQAAALASCYESAASSIEGGSIRTQEAALSVIRTASQTKINKEAWSGFLDTLSEKITEKLAGSSDVKSLGTIFSEIAEGLKAVVVSDTGNVAVPEASVPMTMPLTIPAKPQAAVCPDPTGKACQPQPTIQYRRWR